MGIQALFRNAFNLFRSSFTSLLPLTLLPILLFLGVRYFFNPTIQNWELEAFSSGASENPLLILWISLAFILFCIVGIALITSITLIAYYRQKQKTLNYLNIFLQAVAKIPSIFGLCVSFVWPVLLTVILFSLFAFAGVFLFGSATPLEGTESQQLAAVAASTYSMAKLLELLLSVSIVISIIYSLYLFLLHFQVAQANLIINNIGFWKSIKRSKELVKGRKIYVICITLFIYLLSYAADKILGDVFTVFIGWLLLFPFQACLGLAIYQQLEQQHNLKQQAK